MPLRRLHPNARSLTAAVIALLVTALAMLGQRVWFDPPTRAVVAVRAVATLPTTTTVAVTTTSVQRASRARIRASAARPAVQPAPSGPCDRPSSCPALRNCENGGSYSRGGSWPRYFGAYQFAKGTWLSNGGTETNWGNADAATQDANADLLYARRGRQPWPLCGRYLR